jgi:hypothetical protein
MPSRFTHVGDVLGSEEVADADPRIVVDVAEGVGAGAPGSAAPTPPTTPPTAPPAEPTTPPTAPTSPLAPDVVVVGSGTGP